MKNLNYLNNCRKPHPLFKTEIGDEHNGSFEIGDLRVIASSGGGWEHVSVSLTSKRIPRWVEMCKVKDLFFEDEETVVQYHPKKAEYVNNVSYVLHLWKKKGSEFELPPSLMVGIKELGELE
jgi:hypothetical protein